MPVVIKLAPTKCTTVAGVSLLPSVLLTNIVMPRCHEQTTSQSAPVQTRQTSEPQRCPSLLQAGDMATPGVESLSLSGSHPATLRARTHSCIKSEQQTFQTN